MEPKMKDSGERRTFETGAVRDRDDKKPRPDLISPHANMREGAWLALGAKKYEVRNWESGMPISECVASLCRHLESYKLGLADEDHMAAIRTNAGFILHYEEEIKACRLPASLDDMPHYLQVISVGPIPPSLRRAVNMTEETIPAGAAVVQIQKCGICGQDHVVIPCKVCGEPSGCTMCPICGMKLTRFAPPTAVCAKCASDHAEPGGNRASRQTSLPKPFTVYLCGPITGLDVDYLWRNAATAMLQAHGIKTLDPLRGKKKEDVSDLGLSYKGQLAAPEIAGRDELDILECDTVLAHFPYMPPRQSIGSLMEMGAAAIGFKKPVILCTNEKVFQDHLFCRNFCTLEPDFTLALNRIVALALVKGR